MQEASVKLKIDGDCSSFKAAAAQAESAGRSSAAGIAAAYAKTAVSVEVATKAVGGFTAAMGWIGGVISAVNQLVSLVGKLYTAYKNAGKASEELLASAKKYRDEAEGAGLDLSLYTVLKEQAEKAGVAADEFSEKLKQFKEHKITFDELAASVGSTADAMNGAAKAADAGSVGTRYLADRAEADARVKEYESRQKTERAGLKEIVEQIRRTGGKGGNDAASAKYWDMLMEAAGGSAEKVAEIFNTNKSWLNFHSVGVLGYGSEAVAAAQGRWQAGRDAAAADRAERQAAHDAEVKARREAEAEKAKAAQDAEAAKAKAARDAAEAKARAEREAAERKARDEADALQRRVEETVTARAGAEAQRQKAIDAVRVSGPQAANSLGAAGMMLGLDPSAVNRQRMEEERTQKIREISEKFDTVVAKYDEILRQLGE